MFDADANATSARHAAALSAFVDAARAESGDPRGDSQRLAAALVARARASVASAVGAKPSEIFFTGGGGRANALGLAAAAAAASAKGARGQGRPRLLLSALEHRVTVAAAEALEAARRLDVVTVAATRQGTIDLDHLAELAEPGADVISCLAAHNESGVVQPLAAISAIAEGAGAALHTDAIQAVGRLPIAFAATGASLLTLAGHKLGAPGGIGALIVREQAPAFPFVAAWTMRARPSLLAAGLPRTGLPLIAALGAACDQIASRIEAEALLATHRDALVAAIERALAPYRQPVVVLGASEPRLPNTALLLLPGLDAQTLLMSLDLAGFAVSNGAACSAGAAAPSASLRAMHLTPQEARSVLRLSLRPPAAEGVAGLEASIAGLASAVAACVARMRP